MIFRRERATDVSTYFNSFLFFYFLPNRSARREKQGESNWFRFHDVGVDVSNITTGLSIRSVCVRVVNINKIFRDIYVVDVGFKAVFENVFIAELPSRRHTYNPVGRYERVTRRTFETVSWPKNTARRKKPNRVRYDEVRRGVGGGNNCPHLAFLKVKKKNCISIRTRRTPI